MPRMSNQLLCNVLELVMRVLTNADILWLVPSRALNRVTCMPHTLMNSVTHVRLARTVSMLTFAVHAQ